jgi:hypothetical protein
MLSDSRHVCPFFIPNLHESIEITTVRISSGDLNRNFSYLVLDTCIVINVSPLLWLHKEMGLNVSICNKIL